MVNFSCRVRTSQTQTLSVTNPTCESCNVTLVVKGEQWSAAHFMTFEPSQSKTFDVTYRPLTMTIDGNKHPVEKNITFKGSIFVFRTESKMSKNRPVFFTGISFFLFSWWEGNSVQSARKCVCPKSRGHHLTGAACQNPKLYCSPSQQLAHQAAEVKH